ncbi:MAG TPA: AI-2E family transporter, partial [Anaerolineae bacterium]|nr:AI-2E family transporter [Anaerolineae bacterium]
MNTRWSSQTKAILVVGSLIAVIWILSRVSEMIDPLIVSFILAYVLNLPVSWIVSRTGWPRTPVIVAVFLLFIALLGLLPVILAPRIVQQVRMLNLDIQAMTRDLAQWAARPIEFGGFRIEISHFYEQINAALTALVSPLAGSALSLLANVATSAGWMFPRATWKRRTSVA